jgi:hypothetical protein
MHRRRHAASVVSRIRVVCAYQSAKVDLVAGLLKSDDAPSGKNEIAHPNQEIKSISLTRLIRPLSSHTTQTNYPHQHPPSHQTKSPTKLPTKTRHNVQPEHSQA